VAPQNRFSNIAQTPARIFAAPILHDQQFLSKLDDC
jgi:hypothetical protein